MGAALQETTLTEVEELLPASVRTLVAVLGLADACKVIGRVGGTGVQIPVGRTRAGDASYEYLAERIGHAAAEKLVAHFGGETLYVPRCEVALTEVTYRSIRRDFDQATQSGGQSSGQAVSELALRYGYSDRRIWAILKRPDRTQLTSAADTRQLGLFG